jgi:surface antigen
MNGTLEARCEPGRANLPPRTRRILARVALALLIALPCIALATPSDGAPAHGGRRKNDGAYPGFSGRHWSDDYGIRSGRCNRAAVGAALGAAAGGTTTADAGKGGLPAVAVAVGAVIGAAVGAGTGRRLDRTDRSCVGHALELAAPGQGVSWTNLNTGVSFRLTPSGTPERPQGCRKFTLVATGSFGLSEGRTVACPGTDGTWDLAPEIRLGQR